MTTLIVLMIVSPLLCKGEEKKPPAPPKLMGEVPISEAKAPTTKEADKKPAEVVSDTTKDDYKLYLKEGHRSSKWDEFMEPAFESFEGGNLATASIFFQRAYDAGSRDPLALFRLGLFKESRGRFDEAAALYNEASKELATRYPKHPIQKTIHKHAGRAYYRTSNYDAAVDHIIKALDALPDDFMLLFMAGQILHIKKDATRAREFLERAAVLPPSEEIDANAKRALYRELVSVTYEQDDLVACKTYLDKLIEIAPTDPIAAKYRDALIKADLKVREKEMIKKLTQ